MTTYRIELRATGSLTQLPDSQKLFGALVYLFSESHSPKDTTAFVQKVFEGKIHLALSNVMPKGYLPMPSDYLFDLAEKSQENIANKKLLYKEIKKRSYISLNAMAGLWSIPDSQKNQSCANIFPYVTLKTRQQLRASIESEKYDIQGLDSKLFSVPTLVPVKIDEQDTHGEPMIYFDFYLQIDETDCDMVRLIEESAREQRPIVLGKRSSQ
jgi:CRISPR/Cas system CSM-associated protein Csm4 (group 5 of RAMP superfamily)